MNLKDFFDYKNQLMKDLCTNASVVRLITGDPNTPVPYKELAYKNIFPYQYVPDTVDDGKTLICYDVDVLKVPNRTYYTLALYIWIFTHKSNARLSEGGGLLDSLASEIDSMLNGNRLYGLGELKLNAADRFFPTKDYLGRELIYGAWDFNRPSGSKPKPSNRTRGE